jgi:hypothetical protein
MSTPLKIVAPSVRQHTTDVRLDNYLPVANGTHFNGNGGSASTALIQTRCRQSRKLLRVISGGADKLQVEWANIWTSNTPQAADASCEFNGPNNVTVRMSIEYPAGNMRMVSGSSAWSSVTAYAIGDQVLSSGVKYVAIAATTNNTPASSPTFWRIVRTYVVNWEGQTDSSGTVVFVPGAYKKSLPIQLSENTILGDMIAVLGAFDSGAGTGTYIPYAGANGASNTAPFVDWVVDVGTGIPAVGSSIVDTGVTTQTNGNTTTANSTVLSAWMPIPYATAITGNIPNKRCVALFGDSLVQGYGGDCRDGEGAGIFVRSVDGATWWRIAQGGNRAGCYAPGNWPWQMSVVKRCTGVVTDLGLNDINNNQTFATTQTNMMRLWTELSKTGVPVYAGYLSPISSSTDSWATIVNQSRYSGAGTGQNPNDDTTYPTSVYGQIQLWLTQDGAPMTIAGSSIKAGQVNHPLEGLIDWRGMIADPQTAWKWNPGANLYTTDGLHPTTVAALVQAAYTAAQMEPVIMGRSIVPPPSPPYAPQGEPPVTNMSRSSLSATGNASTTAGTYITVIGVSPGRYYYGFRMAAGAATAAARSWTLLAGADAAKLKVVQSGTFTPVASAIQDTGLTGAPVWIPAGQVIALALTVPATTANVYLGATAAFANLNKEGLGFVVAGKSTDTAVLTGTKTIFAAGAAGAGAFAPDVFRVWAEIY